MYMNIFMKMKRNVRGSHKKETEVTISHGDPKEQLSLARSLHLNVHGEELRVIAALVSIILCGMVTGTMVGHLPSAQVIACSNLSQVPLLLMHVGK